MFERKELQKAYVINYGPALEPSEVEASTYPHPSPPSSEAGSENSIDTDDIGIYLQGRYRVKDNHDLHLGVRRDRNSVYGPATTVRAGYVGRIEHWTLKALYGEGFQEPNPRVLYGGWTGSGSDPSLDSETSWTTELSAGYTDRSFSGLVSIFAVRNEDTIVNTSTGARNLGSREVVGTDLHLSTVVQSGEAWKVKLWGYYSHLFEAEERAIGPDGEMLGNVNVGDLAHDMVIAGASADLWKRVSVNLRARYVGAVDTVETNPVDKVSSYTTVDLALTARRILGTELAATLKVTNLFDEVVMHPGVREADAGTEPGYFDEAGEWHGSAGWFSSLLPQPGRSIVAVVHLGF